MNLSFDYKIFVKFLQEKNKKKSFLSYCSINAFQFLYYHHPFDFRNPQKGFFLKI